jgi:hypothetical protein
MRAHEPRIKAGDDAEKAQLCKELADLKYQLNQPTNGILGQVHVLLVNHYK